MSVLRRNNLGYSNIKEYADAYMTALGMRLLDRIYVGMLPQDMWCLERHLWFTFMFGTYPYVYMRPSSGTLAKLTRQ